MLVKTKKLKGVALDWAVAKCEGFGNPFLTNGGCLTVRKYLTLDRSQYAEKFLWELAYSSNWELGGKIIEREDITVTKFLDYYVLPTELQTTQTIQWGTRRSKKWDAYCSAVCLIQGEIISRFSAVGTTPLIAAMRCYVASKLGDEIDIPEELLNVT